MKSIQSSEHDQELITREEVELEIQKAAALEEMVISRATAENTRIAYQESVRCMIKEGLVMPVTDEADLKDYLIAEMQKLRAPATLKARLSALKKWHVLQGLEDPTNSPAIKTYLKGYARLYAENEPANALVKQGAKKDARARKSTPLENKHIPVLIGAIQGYRRFKKARDSALVLVGLLSAYRAQELLSIRVSSIKYIGNTAEIKVFTKMEKTDPDARVLHKNDSDPALCPIRALQYWIEVAELSSDDYVFLPINKSDVINKAEKINPMSTRALSDLIRKWVDESGIAKGKDVKNYSSHSFRRGFATSSAALEIPIDQIMRKGGWKNVNTVMEYIDKAKASNPNLANKFYKQYQTVQEQSND